MTDRAPDRAASDVSAYDRIVDRLDPPVVVVTADDGDTAAGCVVGFHGQCSIDPPRHAVWLSTANRTYRVAQRSSHLAVHVLEPRHVRLAEWFGGTTGDDVDTFADVPVDRGPGGVPLLREVPARFVGRIVGRVGGDGDHACVVLEVESAACDDGSGALLTVSDLVDLSPGHDSEEGAET